MLEKKKEKENRHNSFFWTLAVVLNLFMNFTKQNKFETRFLTCLNKLSKKEKKKKQNQRKKKKANRKRRTVKGNKRTKKKNQQENI